MQEFLVTAIDIGTKKISASSGISKLGEEVDILGSSCVYSNGIEKGKIVDSIACKKSFLKVLDKLEKEINRGIYDIYIGLPSSEVIIREADIEVLNECDNAVQNLNKAIKDLKDNFKIDEDEIICDVSINYYKVDNDIKLDIPREANGKNIYANITIFICNKDILNKYRDLCIDTKYNIKGFIVNINALRNVFLYREEFGKKVIVESGAGVTEIGIFEDGNIKKVISIPLGGSDITSDLSICAGLSKEESEDFKCEYSNIYKTILKDKNEKEIIWKEKNIHKELFFKVCEARIEEILNYVNNELKNTSHNNGLCSIILCSDSLTNFENLYEIVDKIMDYKVKIITKNEFSMQDFSNITSLAIVKEVHDRVELTYEDFRKNVKDNTLRFKKISDINENANCEKENLGHDKKKSTGIKGKIRSLLEDIF